MTENIDPNDIEDCQKQVFDLEAEVSELRAALERARAALERERMELVSASVSVSRARELTLAQEIRANNLSAALERARALVASNSVPHSQWCLIKHGGPCDCYKAHLAAALGSGGAA